MGLQSTLPHKSTHGVGGVDQITPESIGALPPSGVAGNYFERNTDAASLNLGYGQQAHQVVLSNDSRLTDARTPTAHTHDASEIVSGTLDIERIPVLPSQKQIASSGELHFLTPEQEAEIGQGTVVTTVSGLRYVYKGSGDKKSTDSYILLADVTPHWNVIFGKPSTFAPTAHKSSHATGGTDALTPADIGAIAPSEVANNYFERTGDAASLNLGYGQEAHQVVLANDSRLANARTPTAHKSSHGVGGADPLTPSDIGAITPSEVANNYFERTGDAASINVALGVQAHQVVLANDSRLSDPRTPTAHTHRQHQLLDNNGAPLKWTFPIIANMPFFLNDTFGNFNDIASICLTHEILTGGYLSSAAETDRSVRLSLSVIQEYGGQTDYKFYIATSSGDATGDYPASGSLVSTHTQLPGVGGQNVGLVTTSSVLFATAAPYINIGVKASRGSGQTKILQVLLHVEKA